MGRPRQRRSTAWLARGLVLCLALVTSPLPAGPAAGADSGAGVIVEPVMFPVSFDPRDQGDKVWGFLYRPAGPRCATSVMLLLHDVSYASYQWDLPYAPERYSPARALAAAGYPTLAIDLIGHARSEGGDGNRLHLAVQAHVVSQVVDQLRTGSYRTFDGHPSAAFPRVGLAGAGVGSEIAELVAARSPVDALVATGYTHFPSAEFVRDWANWDVPQTIGKGYTYFGGLPHRRAKYMYNAPAADPAAVRKDTALSQFAPSGLVLSMMSQPSRAVVGSIAVPVLVLLGSRDYMFPAAQAQAELDMFTGTADRSLEVIEEAGHSLFLHTSSPRSQAILLAWLRERPGVVPACGGPAPARP